MGKQSKCLVAFFSAAIMAALLLPASSALAVYATPAGTFEVDNPQAGAHPNLTTTFTHSANVVGCTAGAPGVSTCAESDTKKIVQTLPIGVLADPNATPFCTPISNPVAGAPGQVVWDDCPANTQVGTETITARLCSAAVCITTAPPLSAKVFNAVPGAPNAAGVSDPTEEGHLIVIGSKNAVDPAGVPNARLDISVNLVNGDTLVATADNVPASTALDAATAAAIGTCSNPFGYGGGLGFRVCALHINNIAFLQTGATGEGSGHAFITNSTACGSETYKQEATSYAAEVANAEQAFTFTGCDSLPFAPTLDMTLSTTKAGEVPAIDAKVTQNPAEAATKGAKITFPGLFKVSQGSALTPCGTAEQSTGQTAPTCAASSKLGTATVTAPGILASSSLTGDVFLGTGSGGALFNLVANLGGYFPLVARGSSTTDTANNSNVVTEFPDNPLATLASFTQNLNGDTGGILKNPTVCAPMTVTGDFTSHSGKTAASSKTINITECSVAKAKLSSSPNKRGDHPKVTAEASSAGTVLDSTKFTFSKGGTVASPSRLRHGKVRRLARLTTTTNSGSAGATSKTRNLNYKKSKSSSKKAVMTGTLNGNTVTVTASGRSGFKVTFKGLPSTTNLLTGVKLQLLGDTKNWLTLGSKCRKNKVTTKNKDVYGTSKTSRKTRKCKK